MSADVISVKTENILGLLAFREMVSSDVPFVRNSWFKSNRGSPMSAGLDSLTYRKSQNESMDTLLLSAKTIIACDANTPDEIVGWACCESFGVRDLAIHFLYVKNGFRRWGVADCLLGFIRQFADGKLVHTHLPKDKAGEKFLRKHGSEFRPTIRDYMHRLGVRT